jgi:tetratricopeptide (TPR) repeat protein
MSVNTAKGEALPKRLVVGVLLLTVAVLGLGGAVIAVRLRPEPLPTNSVDREVAIWQAAVEEDPDSSEARTGLGFALIAAGRPQEARAALEEAIELDAKNWSALFQLALLVRDEDPDRSVELLTRSVKLAPRTQKAPVAVAWGDLLMELDDPEGAGKAYRVAIADAPYVIEAHVGMARVFEAQGDLEAALAEYRYAARFAPNDTQLAQEIERLEAAT